MARKATACADVVLTTSGPSVLRASFCAASKDAVAVRRAVTMGPSKRHRRWPGRTRW